MRTFAGVAGVGGLDEGELFVEDGQLNEDWRCGVGTIEAEFAPGHAFGREGAIEDVLPEVRRLVAVKRVNAGGVPDSRVGGCEGFSGEAVDCGGGDGDAAGDAECRGVGEDGGDVAAEVREGEMAVRVDHGRGYEVVSAGRCWTGRNGEMNAECAEERLRKERGGRREEGFACDFDWKFFGGDCCLGGR